MTKLALTYDSPYPKLYLGVWADLALLREVTFSNCRLERPVLQLLGVTRGLTKLAIVFCCSEATVQELVAALKQLTNLQELVLDNNNPCCALAKYSEGGICRSYGSDWPKTIAELCVAPDAEDTPTLLLKCLADLANRHRLRSLHLDMSCRGQLGNGDAPSFCLNPKNGVYAAVLAGATALTRLSVGGELINGPTGIGDYVSQLTDLRSLRFMHNVALSGTALGLMAQSVTKLTHLDISGSLPARTAAASLKALTGLKQLSSLGVGRGISSGALWKLGLPTYCDWGDAWYSTTDSDTRCQ